MKIINFVNINLIAIGIINNILHFENLIIEILKNLNSAYKKIIIRINF